MSPAALGVFRAERQGSIDLLVERAAAGEAPSSPCRRGRWPVGPGFTASCPSRTIGIRRRCCGAGGGADVALPDASGRDATRTSGLIFVRASCRNAEMAWFLHAG